LSVSQGTERRSSSEANRVLVLLVFAVGINYIDRGALSVSAPLLSRELALSPARLGLLFSAFFWSYSILQPVAGYLVDRYDAKRLLGGGYLLWSLATGSVAWISRFDVLFQARLILGAGESVAYPAYSKILIRYFPENKRGFANSVLDAASKIGPAISILLGGLFIARHGWRPLFAWLGVISLLWLLPWTLWGPKVSTGGQPSESGRVSVRQILGRREAWGTSLGMFGLGYVWSFLLSWLPTYLVNERGFSMKSVALLGSLPFWGMAGTSVLGGWLSDRWIANGASVTRVRKSFVSGGLLLCCANLLPIVFVHDSGRAILLLVVSCLALGLFTSNVWAITQTLAGPRAAGLWTGIQNAIGNMGGVVSPYVTGVIIGRTGSYFLAFVACSAALLAASVAFGALLGEIRPLNWDTHS
jgi:MFS family permease